MQTSGGTPAAVAIESSERDFSIRVKVDWNMNGLYNHAMSDMTKYVESATTDRSIKGDQSEDLMIIEGSAAAQLTLVMAGEFEGLSLTSIFSPYQVRSPFWGHDTIGMEITYEIGIMTSVGMVWYPQFVGMIRTLTPDRASNSVRLEALDRVELLRRPVEFPAWSMFGPQRVIEGKVLAQLADTQWVLDHCLRPSNTSPTPWRPLTREEFGLADDDRTGPQLWVSGLGGIMPSIGWLDNGNQQKFPSTETGAPEMYETQGEPHPNANGPDPKNLRGLGTTGNSFLTYWGSDRTRINPVGIQVAGFTMITRGSNATFYQTAADHTVMSINVGQGIFIYLWVGDSGKFWTQWVNGATTITSPKVTIPTGGSSQRLLVAWDAYRSGGARVYVKAGSNNSGADWTNSGVTPPGPGAEDLLQGQVIIDHRVALNDIVYTATNFGSLSVADALLWGGQTAAYAAELDAGLNRLSFLPIRRAADAWEIISDVASAEFGTVFWGEDGIFRFWNQDTLTALKSVVAKTVTLDEVSGLVITNHLDSVRNIWSLVNATKMAFTRTAFDARDVDAFYVPGVSRRIFTVAVDDMLSPNPGFAPRYSTTGTYPAWTDDITFGYVVQWFNGSVWAEDNGKTSGVDVNAYFNHKGELEIEVWNGYSEPARFATNAGSAAYRVNATVIVEDEPSSTTFKDFTSINKYRGRNIALSGDWHQEYTNQLGLVSGMLTKTSTPNPITDAITMAGDPRIQLGDTIRINDIDGFGERFDVQVYGINRHWSLQGGLQDTYSVELVRPAGSPWDDPVYAIWDDTFMWGV